MDISKIKLIIWDLDDTFWKGTLSEGEIEPIEGNVELVKELSRRGIVNSICSKNDAAPVQACLKNMEINEHFVFCSIDWTPKGQRIGQLIKDIGLRPQNCLFIDDNVQNLNEARFYSPDLMIAEPSVIPLLQDYVDSTPVKDAALSRLKQYQVLEHKHEARIKASDNEEFLYSSRTQVEIHRDCLSQLDRIHELVNRTNQLNFTKLRSTKEELKELLCDSSVDAGYVTVKDRFGDYGIVGFFAIKEGRCIHFLFSCRTIGQGVEQYVYATLGYPKLSIIGDVVNNVDNSPVPQWINKNGDLNYERQKLHKKIILKGGCDFKIMIEYLNTDFIIEEFTYHSILRHNNIEHFNHSVNYLSLPFLQKQEQVKLTNELVFNDEEMFHTAMYDEDISLIFISTLIEPNLGIYRNKESGLRIAFGEYLYPLTDSKNWDLYINNKIFTADNHFTREWLTGFSNKWVYEGPLSPEQIVENAKKLLEKVSPDAKVCFLLGSETPFLKNTQPNYNDRHLVYKQINDLMREFARTHDRVLLIDFNDYIRGQEDFTNNINHFHRRVYYEVATKANEYITALTGEKLRQKSRFYLWRKSLIDKIGETGFFQSECYTLLKKPFYLVRKLFS